MITFFGNGMLSCTGDLRFDCILGDYNYELVHYAFHIPFGYAIVCKNFFRRCYAENKDLCHDYFTHAHNTTTFTCKTISICGITHVASLYHINQ